MSLFVSAWNSSDEPIENPFEAHADPEWAGDRVDAYSRNASDEFEAQMPPIQSSYWVGVMVLLVLGMTGLVFYTSFPPIFVWNMSATAFLVYNTLGLGTWMTLSIPFALVRLVLHRRNIARAIEFDRYPGTQRFGLWYLIWSILFSWLCIFSGFILFFGICTAIWVASNPSSQSNNFLGFLLVGDGLLSILYAGFLFYRGIPRYR